MSKTYICNSDKYYIGVPAMDTICLPISIEGLPQKISIEGYDLILRSSFHVSLVCIGKIIEKHKITIPNLVENITKDFCDYVTTNSVDFLKHSNQFRFASQGERRTIVSMCEVSNLCGFFDQINQKYDLKAEYQPTHVTLYTLQPDKGIFLADPNDIQELTKIIPNPLSIIL